MDDHEVEEIYRKMVNHLATADDLAKYDKWLNDRARADAARTANSALLRILRPINEDK